jgi:glutathione S-transferase
MATLSNRCWSFTAAGLSHPYLDATFRGAPEWRRGSPLSSIRHPIFMGPEFSAADLLLVSPYTWMPQATPDVQVIRDWIERCEARPSARQAHGI